MLGGRLLQFRLWVSAESKLLSSPINKTALFLFTTWWGQLVHSGAEQVMHHAAVPALSCSPKRWVALLSYLWLSSRCTPNTFRWLLRLSEFCISRKFLSQDRFEHRCTILPAGPWQPGTACCPPPALAASCLVLSFDHAWGSTCTFPGHQTWCRRASLKPKIMPSALQPAVQACPWVPCCDLTCARRCVDICTHKCACV